MYKISIIIPIYNVRDYIGRCVESVLLQECSEVAIECILIDDCSPDDSMEIATKMIDDYRSREGMIQFETLRLSENSGHCAARNAAVRIATGDYYLFVDADDYLEPDAVRYMVEELDAAVVQPDVVVANAISCRDNRPMSIIPKKRLIDNSDGEGLSLIMNLILLHTSWNKLVKANVFAEYGLYFADGIINEDWLWSYMLFRHAKTILLLPRATYYYENNPQSISNTRTYDKFLKFIRSRNYICNQIFSNPPHVITPDYYGYLFCILHRMVNTLENHKELPDAERMETRLLRRRLMCSSWKSGYPLLCCLILTTYKPFYYVIKLKAFRHHFYNIKRKVVTASRKIHF